ncbi:hypothetical protein BDV12DRAFT_103893 [Aspergillus spectabilis]
MPKRVTDHIIPPGHKSCSRCRRPVPDSEFHRVVPDGSRSARLLASCFHCRLVLYRGRHPSQVVPSPSPLSPVSDRETPARVSPTGAASVTVLAHPDSAPGDPDFNPDRPVYALRRTRVAAGINNTAPGVGSPNARRSFYAPLRTGMRLRHLSHDVLTTRRPLLPV